MDIWEANSVASAYTLHPCDTVGQVVSHKNWYSIYTVGCVLHKLLEWFKLNNAIEL